MLNLELFSPCAWPSTLPALIWKGWRLTPGRDDHGALDLSGTPLVDALKVCYSELGLVSLARLAELFPDDREMIFQSFGMRWSDRLSLVCEALRASPVSFQ